MNEFSLHKKKKITHITFYRKINTIKIEPFSFYTLSEILQFSKIVFNFMNKLKFSLMALLSFSFWAYHYI